LKRKKLHQFKSWKISQKQVKHHQKLKQTLKKLT